jgi:hypothetical protein
VGSAGKEIEDESGSQIPLGKGLLPPGEFLDLLGIIVVEKLCNPLVTIPGDKNVHGYQD